MAETKSSALTWIILVVLLLVVGGSVLGCMSVVYLGWQTVDSKKEDAKASVALTQVKMLSAAAENYKIQMGVFPPDLDTLTQSPEDGSKPMVDPGALIDPWGAPYQYDPEGPKNSGAKPDIWCASPQGLIGNWK